MRVLLWFYVQLMNETRGANGENTKYGTVKTISKQRGGVRWECFAISLFCSFGEQRQAPRKGAIAQDFSVGEVGGEVAYKGKGVSVVSD